MPYANLATVLVLFVISVASLIKAILDQTNQPIFIAITVVFHVLLVLTGVALARRLREEAAMRQEGQARRARED